MNAVIQVESWEALVHRGQSVKASVIDKPSPPTDPESTAVIMYTSGTTGQFSTCDNSTLYVICLGVPKGVVLSHRALAATVGSAVSARMGREGFLTVHCVGASGIKQQDVV